MKAISISQLSVHSSILPYLRCLCNGTNPLSSFLSRVYSTVLYFTLRCLLMSSKSKTHVQLLFTSLHVTSVLNTPDAHARFFGGLRHRLYSPSIPLSFARHFFLSVCISLSLLFCFMSSPSLFSLHFLPS